MNSTINISLIILLCYSNIFGLVLTPEGSIVLSPGAQTDKTFSLFGPEVEVTIKIRPLLFSGTLPDGGATAAVLKALSPDLEAPVSVSLDFFKPLMDRKNHELVVPERTNSTNPVIRELDARLITRVSKYLYKTIGKVAVCPELLMFYFACLSYDRGIMQPCQRAYPELFHLLLRAQGARIFDQDLCPVGAQEPIIFCTTSTTHYYNCLSKEDGVETDQSIDSYRKKNLRDMLTVQDLESNPLRMTIIFSQQAREKGQEFTQVLVANVSCSGLCTRVGNDPQTLSITIYDPYALDEHLDGFNLQCAENFVNHLFYLLTQIKWVHKYAGITFAGESFMQTRAQKVRAMAELEEVIFVAQNIQRKAKPTLEKANRPHTPKLPPLPRPARRT